MRSWWEHELQQRRSEDGWSEVASGLVAKARHGKNKGTQIVGSLHRGLRNPDARIRAWILSVARSLVRAGIPFDLEGRYLGALEDPDPEVREAARELLIECLPNISISGSNLAAVRELARVAGSSTERSQAALHLLVPLLANRTFELAAIGHSAMIAVIALACDSEVGSLRTQARRACMNVAPDDDLRNALHAALPRMLSTIGDHEELAVTLQLTVALPVVTPAAKDAVIALTCDDKLRTETRHLCTHLALSDDLRRVLCAAVPHMLARVAGTHELFTTLRLITTLPAEPAVTASLIALVCDGDAELRAQTRRACTDLTLNDDLRGALHAAVPRMLANVADTQELAATLKLMATLPPAPAAVPGLRELLDDADHEILLAAHAELARIAPADPALRQARLNLFGAGDAELQRAALAAASVDELLLGVRDPDVRARRACLDRLFHIGVIGEARIVLDDIALQGVEDPDPLTAAMCAALCGRLAERALVVIDPIIALSEHPDEDVAAYATHALASLLPSAPDRVVIALLRVALRDDRASKMDHVSSLVRTTLPIDAALAAAQANPDERIADLARELARKRQEHAP